jgi:hypothetical protein
MPKATVRANVRALPKTKPPGAKSRRAAATAPAEELPTDFDLNQARADWHDACVKFAAAEGYYSTMCRELETALPKAEREERLAKIFEEEERLGEVIDAQCDVATRIIAVPASIEALHLKLEIFCYWWAKERNIAAPAHVNPPLNGGDVQEVAASIVLDLLTMVRRGDRCLGASRRIGEVG